MSVAERGSLGEVVVIGDFDFVRAVGFPAETDAPPWPAEARVELP